ncbi:putative kinesin K39 [Leptomonas pyrrhocoris]|uniref:Putative kinesin K39 n=1 Tax=Leptomonas pyrrhocoris TaxID=157538 RepID=A0A0M9FWB7_LEPPY|nr:putative kinesin K39 [Leptomonas pyrrhocoris]KPA77313.1 putative kinesin K39 [Leptomonas pyrrhocoris]|eukprot:XP_015655752.1 putative kinesin K39 [Leptomonas pyrrhocoris]
MMGADVSALGGEGSGVTPRICLEIFARKASVEAEGHSRWSVELGYVEVYNERVSDLLAKRRKGAKAADEECVEVREHPSRGVFLEGQRLVEVASLDDVVRLMEVGNGVRHTAATKMNDRSSRSHAIVMLVLHEERTMTTKAGETIKTAGKSSRMNLVDLAGSERVAQSQVEGQQFKEATHINLSLTTLGRVIDALADMAEKKGKSQWTLPPYRDSKLTFILKDSLGGNSKTFMLATVSPSALNYDETLSTLRYASRAREIVTVAQVNEDPRARRIRELEEQMASMRENLSAADPAYVSELEEKLALLEAEAQKRAADLQALEKEREHNQLQERLLRATEAERSELESRAAALQQEMSATRRQADEMQAQNLRLKEEQARKERELMEEMAAKEAAVAEQQLLVAEKERVLRETVRNLEEERRARESVMTSLRAHQSRLEQALQDKKQSDAQRHSLVEEKRQLEEQWAVEQRQQSAYIERLVTQLKRSQQELLFSVQQTSVVAEEIQSRHSLSSQHDDQLAALHAAQHQNLQHRIALHTDRLQQQLSEKDRTLQVANVLHTKQMAEREEALRDHHDRAQQLEQQLADSRTQAASAEAERGELSTRLKKLEGEHAKLDKAHAKLESTHAQLGDSYKQLDAAKAALEQQLADSRTQAASAEAERGELSTRLKKLEGEHAKLDKAHAKLESTHAQLGDSYKQLDAAKAALEQQLADSRTQAASAEAERGELSTRLKKLEGEHAKLDKAHAKLESTHAQLGDSYKQLDAAKAALEQQLADSRTQAASAEAERGELSTRLKKLEGEHAKLDKAHAKLESTHAQLGDSYKQLDAAKAALEQQLADSRTQAASAEAERGELSTRLKKLEGEHAKLDKAHAEAVAGGRESAECAVRLKERCSTLSDVIGALEREAKESAERLKEANATASQLAEEVRTAERSRQDCKARCGELEVRLSMHRAMQVKGISFGSADMFRELNKNVPAPLEKKASNEMGYPVTARLGALLRRREALE